MATPNAAPIRTGDQQIAPLPPAVAPDPNPPQPQPAAALVVVDEEDRAAGVISDGEHHLVPRDAFRKLKEAARERGRKEAADAINARATALGFPSVEAMLDALEKEETPVTTPAAAPPTTAPSAAPAAPIAPAATAAPAAAVPAQPAAAPAAAPAPAPAVAIAPALAAPAIAAPAAPAAVVAPKEPGEGEEPENDRRVPDAVRKKLRAAREDMRAKTAEADRARQAAEQAAASAQAQLVQFQTQQSMREDLIREGVKDLDFVWFELGKHLKTLDTDDKLKAFDLKAWAIEQRKSRPYLFGETLAPANTGIQQPAPPTSPSPSTVAGAAGDATRVDARTMTPEEFKKRYNGLGLNVAHSSPPLPSR